MRFTDLPQLENNFLTTGNNGEYTFRKIAIPVPGESVTLEAVSCTPAHRNNYFFTSEHPKERILLHFTAGNIRSDMGALTRQGFHVSVPFVIGRNGTIYQLYSSKCWSGNIGKGVGNTNNEQDKRTIGIEISNYAFLTEKDGNLETIYSRLKDAEGRVGPVDIYCSLSEREAYQELTTPFRDQKYYATFANEQYQSLIILIRYLTAQHNIPRQFLPEAKRYLTTNEVLNFHGIVSHVNYRPSGKWDIGPAFDWNRVIGGVQAASFRPAVIAGINRDIMDDTSTFAPAAATTAIEGDVMNDTATIHSEDELVALHPGEKGIEIENNEYEDIDSTVLLEATSGKPAKLYALIVGIDDYRADIILEEGVRFPKLSGCVKDAAKIENYLKTETAFEDHIKFIKNANASKEAVTGEFTAHLGKAGKGDTVLFYYSGHGAQEWADEEVWTTESDGRLECIACYYDEQTKDNFLLSDKELRFLIKKVSDTGAHVVMLFDCCHSGDNTRNGSFVQAAFQNVVEKRIPFSFKKRNWDQFIFSKEWSREKLMQTGIAAALPEGLHVQIAACESDESAVEVNGEGVFTKALIGTLQAAGGDITYQALRSRVRQYLRNIYEQKPRIYVVNGNQNLLYSSFLHQSFAGSNLAFGDVLYNANTGWQLSLGAIHGIGENAKSIKILDAENDNKEYAGTITTVKADISLLQVENDQLLDKAKVYKGYVENLLCSNLRINVKTMDGTPEVQETLLQQLIDPVNNFLKLEEAEPQYTICNNNGLFSIAHPGDEYRPLTEQVAANPENAIVIVNYIKQIARWEHLRNLINKQAGGKLTGNEIAVTINTIKAGTKQNLPVIKDTILIEYEKVEDEWKAEIEIELKNTTSTPLYCAAIYLTYNFGAINNLAPGMVAYIEPGKPVTLEYEGSQAIPFFMNEEVEWYNWKEQTEYLKLIISTEEIDVASLSLDSLPSPIIPGNRGTGTNKGLGSGKNNTGKISGWGTQTIVLQLPNPQFNNVNPDKLETMLKDPLTADSALGIYFDATVGENQQSVYQLKSSIQLRSGDKELLSTKLLALVNLWLRKKGITGMKRP